MKKEESIVVSINQSKVISFEIIGFCISFLCFYIPYIMIWTVDLSEINLLNTILFSVMLIVGIKIHEILHGIGFVIFGKIEWKNLKFGIKNKGSIFYTYCTVPVKMKVYRIAILLPGIILGLLPSIAGIFLGSHWLVLYGVTMISGAATDFVVFFKTKGISSQEYAIDSSDEIGFEIIKDTEKIAHLKINKKKVKEKGMKELIKGIILYLIKLLIIVIIFYYLGYIVGIYK